jgi:hypothetical protein
MSCEIWRTGALLLMIWLSAAPTRTPETRPAEQGAQELFARARDEARAGETDAAIRNLEHAAALGFTDFYRVEKDPDLDTLRDEPRFRRLLANKDRYLRRTAEGTLAALRNRFGDAGYHYEIDDRHRLVFATTVDSEALDRLKSVLADESAALGDALFDHAPEAYITVLIPTPDAYGKLIRFRNVPGLYVDSLKTLAIREVSYVLAHEFAHALHAADRSAAGQAQHAEWLTEGIGVMCESASFERGKFAPRDNPRFATLPQGARRKALIPLDRLVAMNHEQFLVRPNLTYGESGYLVLYLWEKKLLRKFYDEYKSTYDKDPTGREAMEKISGKQLADLQDDWRLWLAARPNVATPATAPAATPVTPRR